VQRAFERDLNHSFLTCLVNWTKTKNTALLFTIVQLTFNVDRTDASKPCVYYMWDYKYNSG
jgi:hypothetical protein